MIKEVREYFLSTLVEHWAEVFRTSVLFYMFLRGVRPDGRTTKQSLNKKIASVIPSLAKTEKLIFCELDYFCYYLFMKKQISSILSAIILIVLAWYTQTHHIPSPKSKVSGSTIKYDKSIKTVPGQPIQVVRVVDGDTVELINGERLRYIGIDTPEEVDARKPVQCFAYQAAEENRRLVEGKNITFQKDVSTYDKYGRWLGFVYLEDGTFVNLELVKNGYAFAYPYPPDISKSDIFRDAQAYAREHSLGLWAGCDVNTLSTGREQTNPQ